MEWQHRLRRRLKFRDLDTFVTVAECGSMAKAASKLSVSQPAISNAIAGIKEALGVPLFDRLAQGVELTRYGQCLLRSSATIFDDMQQGLDQILPVVAKRHFVASVAGCRLVQDGAAEARAQ